MTLTTTMELSENVTFSVRLDVDAVRREHYAIRAMAALRQALATDRVDWRIEPHWDGFTAYGDPGDPILQPFVQLRDDDDNLIIIIGEHFQTVDFINDLSDADRKWYSGLLRIERDKCEANRTV